MKPFGKTYLIKCDAPEDVEKQGNLYIVNDNDKLNDAFWKGVVIEYGQGWTEEEKKNLVPIGSKIIMTYGKKSGDKNGIKLFIHNNVYYVRDEKEILGIIEE